MAKKKIVIVTNYSYSEESYGLLGPQSAATIIEDNTDYQCIVLAVGRECDKGLIKKSIIELTGSERPIIGFSHLAERMDLWQLARELKEQGAITILGGPQSVVDYRGEVGWQEHEHRFHGVADCFTFALGGPAEQIIPLLNAKDIDEYRTLSGAAYRKGELNGENSRSDWNERFLAKVRWETLYSMTPEGPKRVEISSAQVVQQMGCPYAARRARIGVDYPVRLNGNSFPRRGKILVESCGCSFCDVARDKGAGIRLSLNAVLEQIEHLPQNEEGRKIPFELINENPFPSLKDLLLGIQDRKIRTSQIKLVTRTDWLVRAEDKLREALHLARSMDVQFLLSGVGFESFVDSILENLNKGYTVETNLAAVNLMRRLKEEFGEAFLYTPAEGAIHGLIHPTPWDTEETQREMFRAMCVHDLAHDILPSTGIPLIIHHASWLGDWIRALEVKEGIQLKRRGAIIEWW